jgi:UDP-glucose:(heptosyl)LPS alpha-1,3-glucosyltransferase
MHKKRIAIMLPKLSRYGGVEGFAWRLANDLSQKYSVDFICSKQTTRSPEGVRVICIGRPCLGKAAKILWFALGAEWIRRRNRYDVSIGLGNTVCQDILRISGGPTRIFWRYSQKAYASRFARQWKTLRRRLAPSNHLTLLIERLQIRYTQKLVANSHLVKSWLLEAYPQLKDHDIRIIYNKPDLKKFSPCSSSEKRDIRNRLHLPDKIIIGTAATNFTLKGIGPLIKTLPFLADDHILIIAGGRNPAKYRRLARRLGVLDRVYFLGRVDDMPSFYRASDLFILLSFHDACSNAILEALATGIPVISTTTNGSSIVLPNVNSIEPDSPSETIASVIGNAINRRSQLSSINFPADAEAGLEPYIRIVAELLETKTQPIPK